jgi:hypothetical protein
MASIREQKYDVYPWCHEHAYAKCNYYQDCHSTYSVVHKNGYQLVRSKHAIIFTKRNFKLVCDIKAHTDKKINVCCVSKET